MLAWLVDVVNMFNYINPVPIAFPNDFDSDINLAKSRFTVLVELANCDDDTEKCEAQLEVCLWNFEFIACVYLWIFYKSRFKLSMAIFFFV